MKTKYIINGAILLASMYPAINVGSQTVEGYTISAKNTTQYLWKDGDRIRPTATVTVKNANVDTLRVTFTTDKETIVETKTALGLTPNSVYDYKMREQIDLEPGESTHYTMTIETGDSKYVFESSLVNAEYSVTDRRVVCEEGTGTWCGFCVRGVVGMEYMKETYPDFIGIAVHVGQDIMTVDGYSDVLNSAEYFYGSAPKCIFNRKKEYMGDPYNDIEQLYRSTMSEPTVATHSVEATIDKNSYKLEVRMKSSFTFTDQDTPLAYSFIVLENGVSVPGDENYYQKNYYTGGSMGDMGGFADQPEVITDFVFNDVARYIHGGFYGVDNSVGDVVAGEVQERTYVIDIPSVVRKPDNMEIVSIIIDRTNGEILNADMVKPVAGTVSGVEDNRKDGSNFKATSREGGIMITTEKPVGISIYGIGGTLMSRTYVDGTAEFELPAGYYIVKSESDTTSVQKVMAK